MRKFLTIFLVVAAVSSCQSYIARPAFAAEFSADTESIMSFMPGQKVTGKVYVKGNKYRMEMTMPGGPQGIIIGDNDAKMVYNLMPQTKSYMEMPSDAKEVQGLPGSPISSADADIQELGMESVNGYECKKTKYVFKDAQRGTLIYWMSTKLDYPLKYEINSPKISGSGLVLNIEEAAQPDNLFKLPSDYRKIAMPQMPQGGTSPLTRQVSGTDGE